MELAFILLKRFWPFVIIAVLTLACYVQTHRLNATKAEYASFVAQVKAVGEAQEAKTKADIAKAKSDKERADNENIKTKRDLASVYTAYGKLRDSRSYRGLLPPVAAGSSSTEIRYDRAGLAEAMGILERGIPVITRKGDEAIADLNTAKEWAR